MGRGFLLVFAGTAIYKSPVDRTDRLGMSLSKLLRVFNIVTRCILAQHLTIASRPVRNLEQEAKRVEQRKEQQDAEHPYDNQRLSGIVLSSPVNDGPAKIDEK